MIISVSCVRNEEDILEAFVRYHCGRFDRMVIADHESDDRTPRILDALQAEGLPIERRRVSGPAFPQAEILTELMGEAAAAFAPDWLLPLDADEFVRGDLRRLPPIAGVVVLPWQTYVPTPEDPPDPNPARRITHRKRVEAPPFAKVAVHRTAVAHASFRLSEGSHAVAAPSVAVSAVAGLALAHFPVRSEAQVRRKSGNFARRALVPGMLPGQSYHLARLAEACRQSASLSPKDLQHLAATYAATGPVDESLVYDPLIR